MASEVTLIAVPGKMHIYAWVIEVACINSEVKFVLKGLRGCFGLNGLRGHLNDHLKQPTIDTTEAVKHYMISYFLLPLVAAGLKGHCPLVLWSIPSLSCLQRGARNRARNLAQAANSSLPRKSDDPLSKALAPPPKSRGNSEIPNLYFKFTARRPRGSIRLGE